MRKIASFEIDHNALKEGFYLSRADGDIFTYDLRFKKPNKGNYLSDAAMHTIEHLMATVLRNGEFAQNIIYFGPMGCRTGFYLLLRNTDLENAKKLVKNAVIDSLKLDFIPGNKKIECGNYRSHSLTKAKAELENYLNFL